MQRDIMSNGAKMSLRGKLLISECIVTEGNGGGEKPAPNFHYTNSRLFQLITSFLR